MVAVAVPGVSEPVSDMFRIGVRDGHAVLLCWRHQDWYVQITGDGLAWLRDKIEMHMRSQHERDERPFPVVAELPIVDIPLAAWCDVHQVHHVIVGREHAFVHEPTTRTPDGRYRVRCRCSEPFDAGTLGAAHDALFAHLREMSDGRK